MNEETRIKLAAKAEVNAKGEFEIFAITAGMGNGWNFSPEVLQASLALWDGVNSFVDHTGWFDMPSVMRLGGVAHSPVWDAEGQGVKLTLRPVGPMGEVIAAMGREWLASKAAGDVLPDVGFSADLSFSAKGDDVVAILQVFSVDLVVDPARGGEFLRVMNQQMADLTRREVAMKDQLNTPAPPAGSALPSTPSTGSGAGAALSLEQQQLEADKAALRTLLSVAAEQKAASEEAAKMRELRVETCGYVLDTALAGSRLPAPAQDRVRKQFAGKVFEAKELNEAIDDARRLVAELTAGSAVGGPRVGGMFDSGDQLSAAVHDLFGAERPKGTESLKVAKLSGVRELYLMLTGDEEFYGGYYPDRVRLSTGNFTGLVSNVMNKVVVTRWAELGRAGYDWWTKIAHTEHFSDLKQITWLITGTVASLPSIAKGAEYTPLFVGDGSETSNFTKYGGYVGIDLEDLINDDTRKLKNIPRELASAAIRNISELCAAIFTSNSAVGPTMTDGGALFNSTAVTTVGGHANLLTTALGTDYTAWNAVAQAVYNQPMLVKDATGYAGTGKKLALDPKFCLVPRALKAQAEALFIPRWAGVVDAGIAASGGPTYGGAVVPVTVPEWTDATDWAAVCDPTLVPGLCIGEAFGLMPEIFVAGDQLSPAVFMNDESRIKVRHWIAVGVADFRPLHKSNVA